ncbi:hypothetical protein L1N85_26185 [Paenibacillus alkaliterrae]|uniref:hypothetical protein n=1 Tax=Paenibacillus alkaliterrae TaxID=320909 RepID=UPI001F1817FB|nr:hypothetical protein [Paenibacillus alkaliterrae]MCF2941820.1 hypothetical protein [Paenibacillus alkaliterrae]
MTNTENAVEREFQNAKEINGMNFTKPKVYEIICCEERMDIIYDRVEGESLIERKEEAIPFLLQIMNEL